VHISACSHSYRKETKRKFILNVATSIVITYICIMKIEDAIKQGAAFSNVYEKLAVNLMYTGSWLNLIELKFFKGFDLTVQQYNILRILRGQKGKAMGILSITERMIDKTSNSSRLVEKLRQKGLVERFECPEDRRAVNVLITKKGLSLLEKIDSQMTELHQQFSSISDQEANTLNTLLDKLRTQE
jgi:DNA-binding MarR family transcriptional regulator